jgi:hypothetical protein
MDETRTMTDDVLSDLIASGAVENFDKNHAVIGVSVKISLWIFPVSISIIVISNCLKIYMLLQ